MTIKDWIKETRERATESGNPAQLHHLNAWHVLEVMKEDNDFEDDYGHCSEEELTDRIHEEWDR